MKKVKYLIGMALAVIGFSCTDFVDPAIPYSGFETGVYLRTITPPASIPLSTLASANFSVEVEAVDEAGGTTVARVEVFVRRRRGASLTNEVSVATVQGSAFAPSGKYTRTTISIPVSTALTAMGLSAADINAGDFLEYRLALTDTKDRVFTNSNLSPDVSGGVYYSSPFFYRVSITAG